MLDDRSGVDDRVRADPGPGLTTAPAKTATPGPTSASDRHHRAFVHNRRPRDVALRIPRNDGLSAGGFAEPSDAEDARGSAVVRSEAASSSPSHGIPRPSISGDAPGVDVADDRPRALAPCRVENHARVLATTDQDELLGLAAARRAPRQAPSSRSAPCAAGQAASSWRGARRSARRIGRPVRARGPGEPLPSARVKRHPRAPLRSRPRRRGRR